MKIVLLFISVAAMSFVMGWFASDLWSSHLSYLETHETEELVSTSRYSDPVQNINNDFPVEPSDTTSPSYIAQASAENTVETLVGKKPKTAAQKFSALLSSANYDEAILLYQEYENVNKPKVLVELKDLFLSHLEYLITNNEASDFSQASDSFLSAYYNDVDVLLLLANFNQINGFYIEAVNVYQLTKSYAYDDNDLQKISRSFNQFVQNSDAFFAQNEDWLSLSNLYAHIDSSGLLTAQYEYRHAVVYRNLGDKEAAIDQLEPIKNDSVVGSKARQLLQELLEQDSVPINNNPWRNASRVALAQSGNQYLVGLGIGRRDNVTLLIDTGASLTTLSRDSFTALSSGVDVREIGSRLFQTANGVTKGTVYAFSEIKIGPYILKNTPVAVLDFSLSSNVDGLLGMNVLGQFRFQIDQDNVQLLLSRK